MGVPELVAFVRGEMGRRADGEFALGVRTFFKEPVDPWGVRSSDLQELVSIVYREVKHWPVSDRNRFCNTLWKSNKLEEGTLVIHLYRRFARQCGHAEWELFEKWIDRHVHNWAHCDGISSWLLAACIANDASLKDRLPAWTGAKNRWKRRAAAVGLLQEGKVGRSTDEILHIADLLANDKDEMVQKGVGWLLKETYPKKPVETFEYVSAWKGSRLAVRYAAEKMAPQHRTRLGLKA